MKRIISAAVHHIALAVPAAVEFDKGLPTASRNEQATPAACMPTSADPCEPMDDPKKANSVY